MLLYRHLESLLVGEILGAHGQSQPHIILDGPHQVWIAASLKELEVESIVRLMDTPKISFGGMIAVPGLDIRKFIDERRGSWQRNHQGGLARQHFANFVYLSHFIG